MIKIIIHLITGITPAVISQFAMEIRVSNKCLIPSPIAKRPPHTKN